MSVTPGLFARDLPPLPPPPARYQTSTRAMWRWLVVAWVAGLLFFVALASWHPTPQGNCVPTYNRDCYYLDSDGSFTRDWLDVHGVERWTHVPKGVHDP